MNVRSFITSLADGAKVSAGDILTISGIAFDGGYGVTEVVVSTDGGRPGAARTSRPTLGSILSGNGRHAWCSIRVLHTLAVRAINRIGQTQPVEALWSPAGYMRNSIEKVRVTAS